MYTHNRINQLLAAFALGELDAPQRQDVERHLAKCQQCRNELKYLRNLLDAINEIKNVYADDTLFKTARTKLLEAAAKTEQEPAPPKRMRTISLWRAIMKNPIAKLAAAAVIIIAIIITAKYLTSKPQESTPEKQIVQQQPDVESGQKTAQQTIEEKLQAESNLAKKLFEKGDVKGLIALLDSDFEHTKLTAANYLAQIGNDEAIRKLESIAQNDANSTQRQFFVNAANTIRNRIAEKQILPEKIDVNQATLGKTEPPDKDNQRDGVIGIKVIDKQNGKPLEAARLKIQMTGINTFEETTNKYGRFEMEYGRTIPDYLTIKIFKDGFASKVLNFRPKESGLELPKNYLIKMEKGINISGIVQTINGQNVPDANVKVNIYERTYEDIEQNYVSDVLCKTDTEGKWHYDGIPPNYSQINLKVEHAQYIDTEKYGRSVQIEPLTKGDFTLFVQKPLTISGWVMDKNGHPIFDAKLFEGYGRYSPNLQTQTDAQGHFIFDRMYPGETIITAQAPTFAPDMKVLNVKESVDNLQFNLEPGYSISVQVTDSNGKPVEDVKISAREWRKFNEWQRSENISLSGKTDSQGRLTINDAPPDEVYFSIYKDGYARYDKFPMSPQENEFQIALIPQGKITGRVFDAQTGNTVNQFYVTEGIQWKGQEQPTWQTHRRKLVSSSRYEIPITYQDCAIAVKIEADGYHSVQTPPFSNEGKEETYDIYLQKGQTMTGTVFLSNGNPAQGAEVIVATKEQSLYIDSFPFNRQRNNICATTDSLGKFTLPIIDGTYKLEVIHQQGNASVTKKQFEDSNQIVLEPWGKIEGKVCPSDSSKTNLQIHLDSPLINTPDEPRINYSLNTQITSDGKFYFEKVKSGIAQISKAIKLEDGKTTKYINEQFREVKAGEISNVEFPCGGRKITGTILLPSSDSRISLENMRISLRSDIDLSQTDLLPQIDFPVDFLCWNKDQRQQYLQQITQSEEFASSLEKINELQNMLKTYSSNIQQDGSFTFIDVLPGAYILYAEFWNKERTRLLAVINSRVELPESPDQSESQTDIDLGTLQPTLCKTAEVGNTAPDFELDTLDGEKIKLSLLKGTFVLLDLGGPLSNSDYSQNILPNLQQAYDAFEKNGNLKIITITPAYYGNLYNFTDHLEFYCEKNAVKWQFALAEMQPLFDRTQLFIYYNYSSGTKFILVGPAGKILEQDIQPEQLMETLDKYLKSEH